MKKRIFGFITVFFVLIVMAVFGFGHLATRATPSNVGQLADNEEEITLRTSDNIRISASFFPVESVKAPIILMLHGNGASRRQFMSHIGWLNDAGFAAMAIDFRGHGESQEQVKSFGFHEARDAQAAVKWIRQNRAESKIGVNPLI